MTDGEQVVDNLKTLVLSGVVDCCNIGHLSIFGSGMVFEESEDGDDTGWRDIDGQFIFPDGESGLSWSIYCDRGRSGT